MGPNIYLEVVFTVTRKNFFHRFTIELVNILEFNDRNY